MRVSFKNTPIHIGTGIAFIGITNDVLRLALRLTTELPLPPGGKARSPSSPQAGPVYLVNYFLRAELGQSF
jgi:hypothetical protein